MNDKCENRAAIRRYWPGSNPDLICVDHAEDSKRIADAMGFPLVLEPIGYSATGGIPDEIPPCCCDAGYSQKITI